MAKPKNVPQLRDQESSRYATHELAEEFVRFVDEDVLPDVELPGYKQDEKRAVLRHATHNLITTGLVKRVVADSRTSRDRLRAGVWDALVAAGLAVQCRGSEISGMVTRYAATPKLIRTREHWRLKMLMDIELTRNTVTATPTDRALVVLHTGKVDPATGDPLLEEERRRPINFEEYITERAQRDPQTGEPYPEAIQNGLDYWRAKEDTIESINAQNMRHGWAAICTHPDGTTTTFQPNVAIRQIHVGDTFQAARLYSFGELSGQNLSKAVRRTMRIDGEPAAEWDYSGMHPRMLYRQAGITTIEGDPYKPDEVMPGCEGEAKVRAFIKRALNACLNCRTRPAAHSAIANMLRRDAVLREAVGPVPGLVDRMLAAHAPIARYFFTGIGMELMTTDGRVMLEVLKEHRDAGKPALPIHDAVVCKATDAEWTRGVMEEVYFRMLRHWPVIKRVF